MTMCREHYKFRAPNDALRNLFISNHSNCTGHKELYSQQMDSFSVYCTGQTVIHRTRLHCLLHQ